MRPSAPLYARAVAARFSAGAAVSFRPVATAEAVERALQTLVGKLDPHAVEGKDLPDRTLLCVCSDVPVSFKAELRRGKLDGLKQVQGSPAADVRISARSDDLIALIEGRLNVAFAFLMGKIKVDASAADLMLIRDLF